MPLTPSGSFMAGATTCQASPTPDKPDRQDDDCICGVFSKPSSTESCDNIVELSAHSAHEKPSNKIPRLDNDANAPTLRQFECDDPDHLDIVMNGTIQQEKFSDSSEDVTPSVSDLFKKTSLVSEEMFWAFHPHHPTNNVPFNTEATYYRKDTQGTKVRRIWVTYNEEKMAIHCSFCLMFAPERCRQGTLIDDCSDWKHITTRLAEHEKSHCHHSSTEAYFVTKKGKSINHLSNLARREDALERRAAVGCVISVIFFIAFQTLPFRSKHSESAATAFDDSAAVVNHGNFLETVKLIAEFYPTLQAHLNKVVKLAKKRDPKRKGRGNFVTLLSKTSVVKILKLIAEMLKEKIAKYVNDAGLFSVQMDSTTDISTHDQCAVVVRYVQEGKARERLFRLVNVSDSSAQSLHSLLEKSLEEVGVKLDMCVGDSFDGAANMSGVYNGLQALLKQVRPSHVHTWCYAHVLNLVIGDASTVSSQAVSLFGLLNRMANFFKNHTRI